MNVTRIIKEEVGNFLNEKGYMETTINGHSIYLNKPPDDWRYLDTDEKIKDVPTRPCKNCGVKPTEKGHDACIANLPGIKFACCGHGRGNGYLYYENGTVIYEKEQPELFAQKVKELKALRDTCNEQENFYTLKPTVSLVNEQQGILTVRDLAEIGSRTGNDYQTLLEMFMDEYQKGGDEAVLDLYKNMTGQQLYVLSKGRYSLSPTFAPMHEQITDKRTPKERFVSMLTSILNSGYQPYMLKTRGGGRSGISSAAAYQTKSLVDLLPQLSDAEVQELSQMNYTNRNGKTFNFKPYIEHFQRLGGEKQAKADVKNISQSSDQYGDLIKQIKEKIEDFLVEQESKIDVDIKKSWQYIHDAYKTLSREEFAKKFGEKKFYHAIAGQPPKEYYSLAQFEYTRLGILLRTKTEHLPEFITKAQKAYREKEYGKIDKLIYKLKAYYPSLSNFVMTNFRKSVDGIEFTLTADNPDGKVNIYTQTIYAGGYNIQRLHLRWLMHVNDAQGKKIKIEQG